MVDGKKRARRFDRNNYHQFTVSNTSLLRHLCYVTTWLNVISSFQIVIQHVDFWQLGDISEVTPNDVDEWFSPKSGWIAGRYNDTTYCVGEVFSERPPYGTQEGSQSDALRSR